MWHSPSKIGYEPLKSIKDLAECSFEPFHDGWFDGTLILRYVIGCYYLSLVALNFLIALKIINVVLYSEFHQNKEKE